MYDELKFLLQKSPSYFIFWVAQNCNFTCDHCFNYIENKKKDNELTLDEIHKFSKNLEHIKYMTLAGGEPMIRKDLVEITEIFFKNNGLQMVNLVTNGWFTDETVLYAKKVIERCPGITVGINISIDGFKEEHDHIRQQKGSFDRCIATIEALKELKSSDQYSGLSISSSGVYTSENGHKILDLGRYLIETVKIPYGMTLVRGEDIQNNSLKFVDVDHYMKTNNELLRLSEKVFSKKYPFRKVKLAAQSVVTDIIYESAINNRMTVPCKAGEKGFVLMADGELLLCEILNIKIGNLRDHDYDALKILNSESVKEEMAKIKSEKCHCTWECFQMINTVFSPSLYPKVAGKVVGNYFKGFRQETKPTSNLPDSNKVGWRANSLLDK